MPGPGAKGTGTVAIQNYDAWQKICINMDTICENKPVDTTFELFGQTFKYPIFAGPVGAMKLHYGDKYDDQEYNSILVSACADAGIAAFTGDGTNPAVMEGATQAIKAAGGKGIPTIKPWDINTLKEKFALVKDSGAFAAAMDIDAAGLPFLKKPDTSGRKQVCRGAKRSGAGSRRAVYPERDHDSERRPEGKRSRRICHRGIQPRRTCAGSVPADS